MGNNKTKVAGQLQWRWGMKGVGWGLFGGMPRRLDGEKESEKRKRRERAEKEQTRHKAEQQHERRMSGDLQWGLAPAKAFH